MMDRAATVAEKLGITDKVKLITGMSWINEVNEESDEAAKFYDLVSSRLLSHFSVGTIDQIMSAVMAVRFQDIKLSVLANLVILIDEMHAYKSYMMGIIKVLLSYCVEFSSPVIMLSATLTDQMKRDIFKVYHNDVNDIFIKQGYPLITCITDTEIIQQEVPGKVPRESTVPIEFSQIMDNHTAVSDLAVKTVGNGGNLCVVANTVGRAVRIFKEIQSKKTDDIELVLHHAQTTLELKTRKAKEIYYKYGKQGKRDGNRPQKSIVVATTLIAESLDIDFDYMIVDINSSDMLLQEMGRLCRHSDDSTVRKNDWYQKHFIIMTPDTEEWEQRICNPVHKDVIIASAQVLKKYKEICLPRDIRSIINETFDLAGEDWKRKEEERLRSGECAAISCPVKDDFVHITSWEIDRYRSTRYEEYATENVILLNDEDKNINGMEKCRELVLRNTVNVPRYSLPKKLLDEMQYDSQKYRATVPKILSGYILLTPSEQKLFRIRIDKTLGFISE